MLRRIRHSGTFLRSALFSVMFCLVGGFGCESSPESRDAATSVPAMDFELRGSRIIGCCCAAPCPCRINKKPMLCHGCDHTDAVHVDQGFIGKTRMDGMSWIVVGRGFGEAKEGNWVYVYVSDKASEEQVKALQGMLEADMKAWGPKAQYLAGEFKGMRKVPIAYDVSADRREYRASIPGILDLHTKAIVVPGHKEPVVSTGILDAFGDRLVHADAIAHKYSDPEIKYAWDLTGRQSNTSDFVLDARRRAQGAVGWGCWTAHVDFKDQEKYQEQMVEHK